MTVFAGCADDPPSAVVGIDVLGCDPGLTHGSGVVVDDGIVLTSAHTLRGARQITVTSGDRSAEATIVAFDPDLDLAYLRADLGPSIHPMPVDSSAVERGTSATAWTVRDGEVVAIDVTIQRRIRLNTEDIYVDADTTRPGLELAAVIAPGDSGGPVVLSGDVVGVLWARSTRTPGVAYAIDPDRGRERVDTQLATGEFGDVDLARCR